jgi:hypothetical protein
MQLKINQYDTVETGIYNGKWQIKVGRVDQEGNFRPHFQSIKKKDGSQINVPVTLTFDSNEDRFSFLSMCAKEAGYMLAENNAKPQPPTEDVPF